MRNIQNVFIISKYVSHSHRTLHNAGHFCKSIWFVRIHTVKADIWGSKFTFIGFITALATIRKFPVILCCGNKSLTKDNFLNWSIIGIQHPISFSCTSQWFDISIFALQNDAHSKGSYPMSPYKVIIILLTIFLVLYIISHDRFIL